MLYLLIIVIGAVSSLFFDWIFVFLVSLFVCLVSIGVLVFKGFSWWILLKVVAVIVVFHLSYFCIGLALFHLRLALARRESSRAPADHNRDSQV